MIVCWDYFDGEFGQHVYLPWDFNNPVCELMVVWKIKQK